MRKFIYESIVERLKEIKDGDGASEIKHFDLWNNNLVYAEEEQPFGLPAVFIEFQQTSWRYHNNRLYNASEVAMYVHIITRRNMPAADGGQYSGMSLEFFDIIRMIRKALTGHERDEAPFNHGPLFNVQSITDADADELRNDIEVFTCTAADSSAVPPVKTAYVGVNLKINI